MLSLVLGVGLALTLPPFVLGFLAPLPLIWLLKRGGFRYGFLAGLGFWMLHLIWLPQSFTQLFETWLGALPFIPLILLKALSWGLLFKFTQGKPLARIGGWVVLEYLTSLGTLAFPWGFLGYALVEAPGRVLASVGGVYLLSLVVLAVAHGLAQRRYWVLAGWALLWLMPLPQATPDQAALIVQGSINPLQKLQGVSAEVRYLELTQQGLSRAPKANTVIWPESAVRLFPLGLNALLGNKPLVSGLAAFEGGYRNRAVLWEGGQIKATYDKMRLVPFGEFFPWRNAIGGIYSYFFKAFGFGGDLADTQPGTGLTPVRLYGTYICYESVFADTARGLVRGGARVLVNVSNDAWFGPSFGGLQHFAMGRLRAVENGRWLLRAGNDGVTASVDPYGRVVARIPRGQPGTLLAPYALLSGQTVYTRTGNWAVVAALVLALWGAWVRGRARGVGSPSTRSQAQGDTPPT
ncbi:MAG: apolipoprotein N-acyltransferase [Deinococcota bacterium]